jgi:hypothetical protein
MRRALFLFDLQERVLDRIYKMFQDGQDLFLLILSHLVNPV